MLAFTAAGGSMAAVSASVAWEFMAARITGIAFIAAPFIEAIPIMAAGVGAAHFLASAASLALAIMAARAITVLVPMEGAAAAAVACHFLAQAAVSSDTRRNFAGKGCFGSPFLCRFFHGCGEEGFCIHAMRTAEKPNQITVAPA